MAAGTRKRKDEAADAEPETVEGEAVEVTDEAEPVEATPEDAEALVAAEQTQELVLHERTQAVAPTHVLPSPVEWEATMTMAQTIANTPFVPSAYRGQPEAVVAAILYGREIGLGPMQALQKIHMIEGKPSLSADLMLAQMRKGGVVIVASESTPQRAYIHARRSDTGEEAVVEWTYAEADQIVTKGKKLTAKDNWANYPSDMLWARAVGRLARRIGSDLLGGISLYASEEMQDWDEGGYGGSGYDTGREPEPQQPTTSTGVEARADAPRGWRQAVEVLTGIDAGIHWQVWVLQAAERAAGTNLQTLADVPEEKYRDTLILVCNGVANLVEALGGREFPPPTREEIQQAFSRENSVGVVLPGPEQPHDPQEAAAKQGEDGDEAAADGQGAGDAGETPAETAEGDTEPHGFVPAEDAAEEDDTT